MSEAAKWYVIHTYSGYENKVAQNIEKVVENRKLHELIQEVRVPTEKATEITDGKTKERRFMVRRKKHQRLYRLRRPRFRAYSPFRGGSTEALRR